MELKVTEFANIVGVSAQTLKFYERKGIFLPSRVDKSTGYRFYDAIKLNEFKKISAYKLLGFSLAEIKELLLEDFSFEKKIEKLKLQRSLIDNFIANLEFIKQTQSEYFINVKTEQRIHYAQFELCEKNIETLTQTILSIGEKLILEKCPLTEPYYIFGEYLDKQFNCENINCKINFVLKTFQNSLRSLTRDQTTYISTFHIGEYKLLYKAYDQLKAYAKASQLEIVGYPEERYILCQANDTTGTYLTEVRFPILSKQDN